MRARLVRRRMNVTKIFIHRIMESIRKSIFTFGSDTTSWPAYRLILTYLLAPFGLVRWDIFASRKFSQGFEVDDLWRQFSPFSASCSIPTSHSGHSSNFPRRLCHLKVVEKKGENQQKNFYVQNFTKKFDDWKAAATLFRGWLPENTKNST
jgi:hypothetical protein